MVQSILSFADWRTLAAQVKNYRGHIVVLADYVGESVHCGEDTHQQPDVTVLHGKIVDEVPAYDVHRLKFMSDDCWSCATHFRGKHQVLDCARFFKLLLGEPFDGRRFDCGQNSEPVELERESPRRGFER